MNPDAQVLISDPSWENHRALFEAPASSVGTYPYYDAAAEASTSTAMLRRARGRAAPGTIVVLHACCHNPTGCDLTLDAVAADGRRLLGARGLVPFLDMAYQGFGDGIAEDGAVVGLCLARRPRLLRRDQLLEELLALRRAGRRARRRLRAATTRPTRAEPAQARDPHQLLEPADARRRRSSTTVLTTPALRALWEEELAGMRERIKRMRVALAAPAGRPPASQHRHRLHHPPARHVQLLRPRPRRRCSACAASSASTASIPAASAWQRLNERNLDAVVAAISQVDRRRLPHDALSSGTKRSARC